MLPLPFGRLAKAQQRCTGTAAREECRLRQTSRALVLVCSAEAARRQGHIQVLLQEKT